MLKLVWCIGSSIIAIKLLKAGFVILGESIDDIPMWYEEFKDYRIRKKNEKIKLQKIEEFKKKKKEATTGKSNEPNKERRHE